MNKYVQNPDSRVRVNVMEEGGGKIIYTALFENQQKNMILFTTYLFPQNFCCTQNETFRVSLLNKLVLLIIQGRQCDICTKPITCPACGIHHLAILTQGQQGKT